jgi:hypothetical protein
MRHHNRLDEWWGSAGDFDDANGLVDSRCSSPFSMSITAATIRTPDTPAAAPRSEIRRQKNTATWASSGASGVSHGLFLVFCPDEKLCIRDLSALGVMFGDAVKLGWPK